MRKARILLFLGIWVAVLPHLGFPSLWKDILFLLSGIALVYLSYILYADYKKTMKKEVGFDNFAENSEFKDSDNQI